jgi:hypothetical protein
MQKCGEMCMRIIATLSTSQNWKKKKTHMCMNVISWNIIILTIRKNSSKVQTL